jgi:acyl-CoA reductase-like NAD-dependent aldehyde dehydrogenase/nicotinamidase-related amidase
VRPALLLVDLQRDFLEDARLTPPAGAVVARARVLLEGFRALGLPVVHARSSARADLSDAMPHHRALGRAPCVEATDGALPPPGLEAREGEEVIRKRFFGAFSSPGLEAALRSRGVDTVVVAGVHLHACVAETALGAYERGFEVRVAEDATASYDPLHARLAREWLAARAARFLSASAILAEVAAALGRALPERSPGAVATLAGPAPEAAAALADPAGPGDASAPPLAHPAAVIAGAALPALATHPLLEKRVPARWASLEGLVPCAGEAEVERAARAADEARLPWAQTPPAERAARLLAWAAALEARREGLALILAEEVGKPVAEARAEADRTVSLIRIAASEFGTPFADECCGERGEVRARRRPLGAIAAITPWNNPLAIPAGKLAPALALGNTVLWKPAPLAPRAAEALLAAWLESGAPPETLALLHGDAGTAHALAADPRVAAVTFTGSSRAGRALALLCAARPIPFQGEMGGNNAAVVLPSAEVSAAAAALARSAYASAGQGCTATRRLVVHEECLEAFLAALRAALARERVGDPLDPASTLGPLVTRERQSAVEAALARAAAEGASVERAPCEAALREEGCFVPPALVTGASPSSAIAREETFGPVAVLLPARDLDDALAIANGVEEGLVASVYTSDPEERERALDALEAGVLKANLPTRGVDPLAPFGGWKASGLGPPEHGRWDAAFFTRWQAVYAADRAAGRA